MSLPYQASFKPSAEPRLDDSLRHFSPHPKARIHTTTTASSPSRRRARSPGTSILSTALSTCKPPFKSTAAKRITIRRSIISANSSAMSTNLSRRIQDKTHPTLSFTFHFYNISPMSSLSLPNVSYGRFTFFSGPKRSLSKSIIFSHNDSLQDFSISLLSLKSQAGGFFGSPAQAKYFQWNEFCKYYRYRGHGYGLECVQNDVV